MTAGFFTHLIGLDKFQTALETIEGMRLWALLAAGLMPILLWGIAFRIVLKLLAVTVSVRRAVMLYLMTLFFNSVTPFGQAGGSPVSSAVIADTVTERYERILAAVISLNAINVTSGALLGTFGAGYLVVGRGISPPGGTIGAILVTGVGLLLAIGIGWRFRGKIYIGVRETVYRITRGVSRGLSIDPPSKTAIDRRLSGFQQAIQRVAGGGSQTIVIVTLCIGGQLFAATILYIALQSIGATVSIAAIVVLVPLAQTAAVVPTPGGAGSVETMLSSLLIIIGIAEGVAAAGAVLYRISAFWIPGLIGGLIAGAVLLIGNANNQD